MSSINTSRQEFITDLEFQYMLQKNPTLYASLDKVGTNDKEELMITIYNIFDKLHNLPQIPAEFINKCMKRNVEILTSLYNYASDPMYHKSSQTRADMAVNTNLLLSQLDMNGTNNSDNELSNLLNGMMSSQGIEIDKTITFYPESATTPEAKAFEAKRIDTVTGGSGGGTFLKFARVKLFIQLVKNRCNALVADAKSNKLTGKYLTYAQDILYVNNVILTALARDDTINNYIQNAKTNALEEKRKNEINKSQVFNDLAIDLIQEQTNKGIDFDQRKLNDLLTLLGNEPEYDIAKQYNTLNIRLIVRENLKIIFKYKDALDKNTLSLSNPNNVAGSSSIVNSGGMSSEEIKRVQTDFVNRLSIIYYQLSLLDYKYRNFAAFLFYNIMKLLNYSEKYTLPLVDKLKDKIDTNYKLKEREDLLMTAKYENPLAIDAYAKLVNDMPHYLKYNAPIDYLQQYNYSPNIYGYREPLVYREKCGSGSGISINSWNDRGSFNSFSPFNSYGIGNGIGPISSYGIASYFGSKKKDKKKSKKIVNKTGSKIKNTRKRSNNKI